MLPLRLAGSFDLSREFFLSLGVPGLFAVAFLEFFLFPVPPDLVLIPLAMAAPELALFYAAVATAGSVSRDRGIHRRTEGRPSPLESRFAGGRVDRAEDYFEQYGLVTLAVGAFSPIPEGDEFLSISSGALGLDLRSFLLASLVGRGGKYFLEAGLVLALGSAARSLSETHLYALTGAVAVAATAIYLLRRWWPPDR